MVLVPCSDGGLSSLAVAPEHPPQFLPTPGLDSPVPCPNLESPENPLKRLLVPEEGECQLWAGRGWGAGTLTLSISSPFTLLLPPFRLGV